jgi:hypothetical protein
LKTHNNYKGLHSQSSRRVLEELAEAFKAWYGSDKRDNLPGYRKKTTIISVLNAVCTCAMNTAMRSSLM